MFTPTAGRRRQPATRALAPLVVLLGLALGATGCGLTRAGDTGPGSTPATAPEAPQPSTVTTTAVGPTHSALTWPTGPAGPGVAVYYVAETVPRLGPRLYREFRQVDTSGGRVAAAVEAMLRLTPLDPDYHTLWPGGTAVRSVIIRGNIATVDLSAWPALGATAESMAVQQLVYTVTAADPMVMSVRLLVAGAAPVSGHLDVSAPVGRRPALETVAHVWLLAPGHGATVGTPLTVTVYGTGFEGHIPVKVVRMPGASEVHSGFVTTRMGELAEASTTVRLPAGDYEVRVYNENIETGALQLWDSKAFTVR